jgi:hypothetical protein
VFAVLAALLALVQYAVPGLVDNDGYYHMRMARLMLERGLRPDFVWLPLTILRRDLFYDHHLLFHVYLMLFAGSSQPAGLVAGAKLASVILPAGAGLATWWLLRGQGVRWPALWAVALLALSEAFLYRMSMPRAQSASLAVLVLGLHWLLTRRYWALLPLGFAYVWMYDAFPLLAVAAAVYSAAALVTERRLEWGALVFPLLGLALGLVINLYFPRDIAFILRHLAPKLSGDPTAVGNEWYPYDTWVLVQNSGRALAVLVLGTLALAWHGRRIDRPKLAAFGMALVSLAMLLRARRFIEYYPAFALIFAALAIAPLLDDWLAAARARWPRWARWAPLGAAVLLSLPLALTLAEARQSMERAKPPTLYAGASAWLQANTPPGSLVFQTDWDDFPRLFFYNTQNLYTIGLDPTYMELYDADLYSEWRAITRGEITPPGPAIRADFGAEYVMSDRLHTSFLRAAADDGSLEQVYRDDEAVIFKVK